MNLTRQCPYPGLRAFTREEAHLFFGRETQTDELIERLGAARFVAVIGPSGCGKSSLVKAGLLPGLETGFMPGAGPRWRVAEMRPGTAPFRRMAEALADAYTDALPNASTDAPDASPFPSPDALESRLRGGSLALHELLAQAPPSDAATGDANLLLLVDQFEELFRYADEAAGALPDAAAFTALLLASARPYPLPDGRFSRRIYVIITMRSDFIGDCARFPGLAEAVNRGLYLTPRLDRDRLREAIEEPAFVEGGEIDPALVSRLLADAGHDQDQLPLLQHALQWLWMKQATDAGTDRISPLKITFDDYDAEGGFGKLLSHRLDGIYEALSPDHRRAAEILFRSLSRRDVEQRDIRRPVRLAEVAELVRPGNAEAGMAELRAVVDAFSREARHFITWTPPTAKPSQLGPDALLDVCHESLLRHWERLREWLADEARSAEMYERLEKAALRKEAGRGDLWRGLDLSAALEWKKKVDPTPRWAGRYGDHFDKAMRFLEESEAQQRREEEEKRLDFLERTTELYESRLTHAGLLAKMEDYAKAREVLSQTRPLDGDLPPGRRQARNLLDWYARLMGGEADKVYEAGALLRDVAVSFDGRLLAAVGERGTVALFDEATGQVVKRLEGHDNSSTASECDVWAAVFHPDGRWLATAGGDRRVILWAMPGGEKLREWKAPGQVWAMSLSPDAATLATGGADNAITLWNPETGERIRALEGHDGAVSGLAFHPDGRRLASASYDRTARIWEVETSKALHVLRGHAANVQRPVFHPDGDSLVTSSSDKTIIHWNADTGQPTAVFRGHENYVFGLRFLGQGRRLVSGSMDRTLRIWDTDTGVTLRVLQGHTAGIGGDGVKVKGDAIYSAANDGTVRRWGAEVPGGRVVGLPSEPASSAISPDGASVAVGFANGHLQLYSLPECKPLWPEEAKDENRVMRITFSPDGSLIATAHYDDNTVKLWRAADGEPVQTFTGHERAVHAVAFSPDGWRIASASYDGRIWLFEVGKEGGRFREAHDDYVNSVAFTDDGQLLSGGKDGALHLWRVTDEGLEPVRDLPKSTENIMWAAISPDGRRVAAVGRDLVVRVYDAATGREEHAFVGHEQTVLRAEFTPDGGQVVTVAADATVRFWDLKTNGELFTINLPSKKSPPVPAWDFSFRVTPTGNAWIAVPLTKGELVVYEMTGVFGP